MDPDGRQGVKPPPEPATSFFALAVPLTALVAASLPSLALGVIWPHDEIDLTERRPSLQALWPMLVAAASVVVLLRVCPAWSRLERRVVLRCMPPRLTLAWRRVSQGVHP